MEHKNHQFDNEEDIHVSSKNYKESSCILGMDLLTISEVQIMWFIS